MHLLLLLYHRECICCSFIICCLECVWHCCIKTRKTSFNRRCCWIITSWKHVLSFLHKINFSLNFCFRLNFIILDIKKCHCHFFVIFLQMGFSWLPVESPSYFLFLHQIYPEPFVRLRLKSFFQFSYLLFYISISIKVNKILQ